MFKAKTLWRQNGRGGSRWRTFTLEKRSHSCSQLHIRPANRATETSYILLFKCLTTFFFFKLSPKPHSSVCSSLSGSEISKKLPICSSLRHEDEAKHLVSKLNLQSITKNLRRYPNLRFKLRNGNTFRDN